jgi:hypothetical protein
MAASVQAPLEAADPLLQGHNPSPLLDVVEGADGAAFLLPSQTRVGSPLPASCAAASNDCTAGDVVGPFAHKETCVVLDWDDTLFPSSFGAWAGPDQERLGWGGGLVVEGGLPSFSLAPLGSSIPNQTRNQNRNTIA